MAFLFALLSAFCSMSYILGAIIAIIFIFINWKISIVVFVIGFIFTPFAKYFDTKKYIILYGKEAGKAVCDYDWVSGKKLTDAEKEEFVKEFIKNTDSFKKSI